MTTTETTTATTTETTTALARSRAYLADQRRAIIGRSLAASLSGVLPVPFLDTWLLGAILGRGYRKIAAAHQIDLDDAAVRTLVFGTEPPPSLTDMASAGIAVRIASRAARRMMLVLTAINRARSAARTFTVMTLFDHYCARLHTGAALDGETALALREEIGRAIEGTPGALAVHPFRRGVVAAVRATLRAPLELADLATGGAVRKLLARKSEVTEAEAVDDLDAAVERALASKTSFLGRAAVAVEIQLSAEVNPFLEGAIESLDRRWRARVAVRQPR
ncbi:MAG TPA: hypothetical protein VNO30_05765 [Kofleriaceae bacterium]|nr:hypothetical protein [Kofleriaceae bacterium]